MNDLRDQDILWPLSYCATEKKIILFLTRYFHNLLRWHWIKKPTPWNVCCTSCNIYGTGLRGDMDLDPFDVHVFPMAIRHLTSSPRPQLRSIRLAAPPTWPCRRVRSHPLGMGCGTGPARQHRPGNFCKAAVLPLRQGTAGNRCSGPKLQQPPDRKVDAKTPLVSPGRTPAQAEPPAECDPAGLGEKAEGKRLSGLTAAGRGTEGLEWGLPQHSTH